MPLRRHLTRTCVVLAALACWAVVPVSAEAALVDAVQPAAQPAVPQPQTAAEGVVAQVQPAARPDTTPAPSADGAAVQQTVAPVAAATAPATPATPVTAVSATHLREPARSGTSHISATASSRERRSTGADGYGRNGHGAAAPRRPGAQSIAGARSEREPTAVARAAHSTASPALPAPEPGSGSAGPDAAAGVSTGLFFGGGLALLVAALLLAGPRLRRSLLLLPAVCRPVAFLVVLERPG
jgi:hypothetical protein